MNRIKTDPPRGVLHSVMADPARYAHARYHASPDMARYVEHFWMVRWDLRGLAPEQVETLPHPSVHMIFERNVGARVAGVSHGKFSRTLEGEGEVFSAKFKPGGFYPFVGVPVSTFTDRVVALSDVFGADANTLADTVLAATDAIARMGAIEDFLRGRKTENDENVVRVAEMVYAAAADRGIVSVDVMAERYHMNKRTLQRLFAKYVGVSPKWVIQRYRLHEAGEKLAKDHSVKQSMLAAELGYSDQAHFVSDFKTTVGTTPAAYARKVRGE